MKHPEDPGLHLATRSAWSPEFMSPTMIEYGQLQEAMIGLSNVPNATTTMADAEMLVKIEQAFIDSDDTSVPYVLGLVMKETSFPGISWSRLDICYTETSLHHAVRGTHLEHAYAIEQQDGMIKQSWQSVHVVGPELDEPPAELEAPDVKQYLQTEDGLRILMRNFGKRVLLTAGDCSVLHERIVQLKPRKP